MNTGGGNPLLRIICPNTPHVCGVNTNTIIIIKTDPTDSTGNSQEAFSEVEAKGIKTSTHLCLLEVMADLLHERGIVPPLHCEFFVLKVEVAAA